MRSCSACGAEVPAGSAFCGQCGQRVGAAAPAAAALHRSERKVVTVLFADIKGSLALVAGQDPELAGEIMARVVACMGEAVRRHGGVVNQVMGDGVMALFGAPVAMEDHAAQACFAALAMRVAVQRQVRPRVQMRVGLGSGEVVVRGVPGDVGLHYSAAGEAVHLAARMEQAAGPDQVLMTDATRQLAAALVDVRAMEGVSLKGVDGDVPVFELVGMRAGRSAVPTLAGSRLVGRERELEVLRRARDRAAAGEGQAVRLVGDAGSGKSRLVREFTGLELADGWRVCAAEALSHRRTSYGVVSELLGRVFGLEVEDGAPARREKVLAGLDLPAGEREEALQPLSALLGLQAETAEWRGLDSWERRELTVASTVDAFQRLSRRRKLALVVEDVHWLDAESATSIQRVGATASGRRLLSVITERAGAGVDGAAWPEVPWHECAVGPLSETGTLAFLRSRLTPGPDVTALEWKLIEHTRGNPLFLEECLQALLETGELARDGSMLRVLGPIPVLRVPTSLRGLLDARVDRLGEVEKDVLQAASVVGSTVPRDLLRGAVELEAAALDGALGRLVEAGFLVEAGGVGDAAQHAFRHGLIREAAYSGILRRSRVRMHGAVLDALERRRDGAEGAVDLLANHAVQAERWPKAAVYAKAAASRAFGRYANPEAVDYYRQALGAARQLEAGVEQDRLLLELHLGVRSPLFRLGDVAGLGPHLDEAVRLAGLQSEGGHEGLAQALVMRSHVHWLRGEPEAALADVTVIDEMAARFGDAELAVRARYQRGLVALSRSEVGATLACMGAVVAHMGVLQQAGQQAGPQAGRYGLDLDLVVTALGYMARAHVASGALGAARVDCDAALAMVHGIERRQTKIWAHMADGVVAAAEGRPAEALRALALADEFCRGADMRLLSPVAAQFLAQAHLMAGDVGPAVSIARQAVLDAERMGFMALHAQRLAVLAEALLASGDGAGARDMGERALAQARQTGEGGAEAAALGVLGDVLQREGGEAEVVYAQAIGIAGGLGLSPLVRSLRFRAGGGGGG